MTINRIGGYLVWLLFLTCLAWSSIRTATAGQTDRTASGFPVKQTVWKIELNQDAIYRVGYAELQQAGMQVDAVNPHTFELLWRGDSVAYQFEGDEDAIFEPDESLLFYGWRFDESREAQQYVKTNVFWLVEGGTASIIPTIANETTHPEVREVASEVTAEPENTFSLTYTRHWSTFPNEFDSWYWASIDNSAETPASHQFNIDLPHPVTSGSDATYTVELLNYKRVAHDVTTQFNSYTDTRHLWTGQVNTNLTQTVPANVLANGINTVTLGIHSAAYDRFLLNRITVNYDRHLTVDNGLLHFSHAPAGGHTFALDGLATANGATPRFWDISTRTQPVMLTADASYDSTAEVHRFGGTFAENAAFIVSDADAVVSPDRISAYVGPDLTPAEGAEWLAITHSSLLTETERLAAWRAAHSRMSTQVVNVEDVINQYGWGLPLPDHIRDYLVHAVTDWSTTPDYLLIAGSASLNPRQLACQTACFSEWTTEDATLVPTWLEPSDRSMGLVPIDHHYSTLIGDDDRGDIAIGRLPASDAVEMAAMVDKIVQYETNLISAEAWMQNMLFISDNKDSAGDFCSYNTNHIAEYSNDYSKTHYCLDQTDISSVRNGMFEQINDGVLIAHYLGHGQVDSWAGEGILTSADLGTFTNADKPFVQISGNCLDGNYAWVGKQSIAESMLAYSDGGSVAHWGNSGLGYLLEHQIMHLHFTKALEDKGITRIGNAVNYAKNEYLKIGFYAPQAYSSILMADPAMQLIHPELETGIEADVDLIDPGQEVTFSTRVTNTGLHASPATVTYTVPAWVTIDEALTSNGSVVELRSAESQVIMQTPALAFGESATLSVTVRVLSWETPKQFAASVVVEGEGFEADLGNNSAEKTIRVTTFSPTNITIGDQQARTPLLFPAIATGIALLLITWITHRRKYF